MGEVDSLNCTEVSKHYANSSLCLISTMFLLQWCYKTNISFKHKKTAFLYTLCSFNSIFFHMSSLLVKETNPNSSHSPPSLEVKGQAF